MGINIHGLRYHTDTLRNEIIEYLSRAQADFTGKLHVFELLDKILPEFGLVDGEYFYTVFNEYYEDYNPSSELVKAICLYYDVDEEFMDAEGKWVFLSLSRSIFGDGANAREVLDSLELPYSERDYDE